LAFHSGREADHSPPSSAEGKECVELYLHSPNTPSWRGAQLGGAQGQLYLLHMFSSLGTHYKRSPGCFIRKPLPQTCRGPRVVQLREIVVVVSIKKCASYKI
jgi:hypothetical protein